MISTAGFGNGTAKFNNYHLIMENWDFYGDRGYNHYEKAADVHLHLA